MRVAALTAFLLQSLFTDSGAFCGVRTTSWERLAMRNKNGGIYQSQQGGKGCIQRMAMDLNLVPTTDVLTLASPLIESFLGSGIKSISMDSTSLVLSETLMVDSLHDSAISPLVEAEVLNDMAHIALDLATFITPATAALRLLTVIGRILAMSSDYVSDHTMMPEEFVFQTFMLALSSTSFLKSILPIIQASLTSTSFRDRRTYRVLFNKVGLSWLQFKTLSAKSLDWIEMDPNAIISNKGNDDDDIFIYWLYSGEAEVEVNGTIIQQVARTAGAPRLNDQNGHGMLGELHFARALEDRKKKKRSTKVNEQDEINEMKKIPESRVRAGPSGATLLRINTTKLTELMEHDDQLADSIHYLMFTGLQDKLTSLLEQAGGNLSQRANSTPVQA